MRQLLTVLALVTGLVSAGEGYNQWGGGGGVLAPSKPLKRPRAGVGGAVFVPGGGAKKGGGGGGRF